MKEQTAITRGYSKVTMGKYAAIVRKRWIRYNFLKQVIEESSDREKWTQAEEVISKEEVIDDNHND